MLSKTGIYELIFGAMLPLKTKHKNWLNLNQQQQLGNGHL